MDYEYDPEHWEQLQEAFEQSFDNLADSIFNGDIVDIIKRTFDFAANNPLCLALITCVFTLFGFHLFSYAARSVR